MDTLELSNPPELEYESDLRTRAKRLLKENRTVLDRYPGHCALVAISARGTELLVAEDPAEAWELFRKTELADAHIGSVYIYAEMLCDPHEKPAVTHRELSAWYREMKKPGAIAKLQAKLATRFGAS